MITRRKFFAMLLCMVLMLTAGTSAFASARTVNPTESTVIVNGTPMEFEAYLIDGNNFFKLRDLAYALNGTNKQFSVSWDSATNAISLTGGQSYEPIGGEMTRGNGTPQIAIPTTSRLFINGLSVNLTAYNISDNNFFRLRDIMIVFDIGVTWDAEANTIKIDTNTVYHGYGPITAANGGEVFADDGSPRFADTVNLADLTVIPESVHILTPYNDIHSQWGDLDMYVWAHDAKRTANEVDIFVSRQAFDNNNELRIGFDRKGNDVVLLLVRLNDNGNLVGMMYLVPNEMARKHGL